MLSFSFDPTVSLGEQEAKQRRRKMLIFGGVCAMVFIVLVIIGVVAVGTAGSTTTVTDTVAENPIGNLNANPTPQDNSIGATTPASIHTVKPLSGTVSVKAFPFMTRMSVWVNGHVPLVVGVLVAVLVLVAVVVAVVVLSGSREQETDILTTPPEATLEPTPEQEQSPWGVVGIVLSILAMLVVADFALKLYALPRAKAPPPSYKILCEIFQKIANGPTDLCQPKLDREFQTQITVCQYDESEISECLYVFGKEEVTLAQIHNILARKYGRQSTSFYIAPRPNDPVISRFEIIVLAETIFPYNVAFPTAYYDKLVTKFEDYFILTTIRKKGQDITFE